MLKLVSDASFVVVDVETTGMDPWKERITEIAVVKVQDGTIVDEFSTLINPQQFIPAFITELTGITNEMVFSAPKAGEVMPKFLEFVGDSVIVAHNAMFDLKFLNATLQRSGYRTISNSSLCTCRLARRLLPNLSSKSLSRVAQYFDINISQRHRAMADAYATAKILIHFLERMGERLEIDEIGEVIRFQYKPISQFKRLPKNVVNLKDTISNLPEEPGVYYFHDKSGGILYIGKAKNLKDRVSSYFYHNAGHSGKVRDLVRSVQSITYETTGSELSALLLESKLIKKHRPDYNTLIRRYKRYPFIKIDVQSDFPRISWSYNLEADGAEYFGPFQSRWSVESVVDIINHLFLLRECQDAIHPDDIFSPCIYYQIKRCSAPCAKLQTCDEYRAEVDRVREFISGEHQDALEKLEDKMKQRADGLRFEEAADLRNKMLDLKKIISQQKLIMKSINDHNVVIMIPAKRTTVELFFIRFGRLQHQAIVDQSKFKLNEIAPHVQGTFFNGKHKPKAVKKEELDEMRIIASWLTQHKDNGQIVYVQPNDTPENLLGGLESKLASFH